MRHSEQLLKSIVSTAAYTLFAIALACSLASAKEKVKTDLMPGTDADAQGQVRVMVRSATDGRFELRVRNLDPNSTFDVLVSGVKVGTVTTSGKGAGNSRFRSRPHGHDQLLGFDPRGTTVALQNAAGDEVLRGMVPAGTTSGLSNGKIACCIPDDSGTECDDRTPDECTARGGSPSTASTCLPNPCGATTPSLDTKVVCCIPDDGAPECEDRTADQCAARGGIVVTATSCTPNPCVASADASPTPEIEPSPTATPTPATPGSVTGSAVETPSPTPAPTAAVGETVDKHGCGLTGGNTSGGGEASSGGGSGGGGGRAPRPGYYGAP